MSRRAPEKRKALIVAALADPRISRALEAVHSDPGSSWTVEGLAKSAGMSRSVFAKRKDAKYMYPAQPLLWSLIYKSSEPVAQRGEQRCEGNCNEDRDIG